MRNRRAHERVAALSRAAAAQMKDYQVQLEKLRRDAAECALIRDLATDGAKRELFDRLAVHLDSLADHVEQEMLGRTRKAG